MEYLTIVNLWNPLSIYQGGALLFEPVFKWCAPKKCLTLRSIVCFINKYLHKVNFFLSQIILL